MKKDTSVNIISFRVDINKFFFKKRVEILGLGTDSRMYYWNYNDGEWYCYWQESDTRPSVSKK